MKIAHTSPGTSPGIDLVIGYGSSLRSDDGLGLRLAALVADCGWPGVEALAVHQLNPELAEALAGARRVVFVDAYAANCRQEVLVQSLHPDRWVGPLLHATDPRHLLMLARDLYGHLPQAWLVAVPGSNFDLGDSLSPAARRGLQAALERVAALLHASCRDAPYA
jgi:hydrogenase maturation protease